MTREQKKASRQCRSCSAPAEPGRERCRPCLDKELERKRRAPKKGTQACTACGQPGHNRRSPVCPAKGQRS